jgi:capsular polysaccharide biosynthesis protein
LSLGDYVRVTLRYWPLALVAILVTTGVSVVHVLREPQVFESKGTYIVTPRPGYDAGDTLRAMDALVRGVEINATYATIGRSQLVKDRAKARLGSGAASGVSVRSEAVTGTNILEISVSAAGPEDAHAFADAVGKETVRYVDAMQEPYELSVLDPPAVPSRPVANNGALTILTGVGAGGALAVVLSVIAGGIASRREETAAEPHPVGPTFTWPEYGDAPERSTDVHVRSDAV